MNAIKVFTILTVLLCWGLAANAQDPRLKKANDLFDKFNFPEAAESYKKILTKEDIPEAKIKLAEAYRLMNMPIEAEYWYEQAVDLPESEPIHRYHYAMALKANGKCEEAKTHFMQYAQLVPADTRGLRQIEACEQVNYFLTDPGIYKISITNINSAKADFGPAFYREGIVFASEENVRAKDKTYDWTDAPFLDLFYAAQKGDNPASLEKPEVLPVKINTWLHEGTVTFTQDYQTVYFTRNNFTKGKVGYDSEEKLRTVNLKIYESKSQGENKWETPALLPFNHDDYSTGHPTLSYDEQALYFVSDMPGGYGGTDIYVSYKSGDSWGEPENLGPEINTEGNEMFPFMSKDGVLYFASNALPGLGGLDIFASKLLSDGTWSAPENLRYPINTNGDDFAFIINPDNEIGYFSSNRPGGKGNDDIYSFTRLNNIMTGKVVDCNDTEMAIENAMVELKENDQLIQKRKTNANGMFTFPISPGKNYTVVANKAGYEEGSQDVSTIGVTSTEVVVQIPICPEKTENEDSITTDPNAQCEVIGKIMNVDTNEPVEGAIVTLTNVDTKEELKFTTTADGIYTFKLDAESSYVIHATKEYYFTESKTISTVGRDCSDPLQKDLAIDIPIKKIDGADKPTTDPVQPPPTNGGDPYTPPPTPPNVTPIYPPITINDNGNNPDWLPQLNHIYYDFDKHFIREDAKPELDKIVQFMAENPALVLELRSHTDSRGSNEYNQALSQRRAQAAVDYLVSRGINRNNITAHGYGETQLTNECGDGIPCSDVQHQQNRRTEFVIIGYRNNAPLQSVHRYFTIQDRKNGKNYYKDGSGNGTYHNNSHTPNDGSLNYNNSGTNYNNNGSNNSGSYNNSGSTYTPSNSSSYNNGGSYTNSTTTSGSTYTPSNSGSYSNTYTNTSGNNTPTYYDQYNPPSTVSNSYTNNSSLNAKSDPSCCGVMPPDNPSSSASSGSVVSGFGMEYKIQLGAFKSPNLNKFNNLNDIGFVNTEATGTGVQRVIMGGFNDNGAAQQALSKIRQRGFNDAFIVKYQDGQRIGR